MRPTARASLILAAATTLAAVVSCTEPLLSRPTTLTANTPTALTGTVGTEIDSPPAVRVTDAQGHPVAGVSVTFEATAGWRGTVDGGQVESDAEGVARVSAWKLGTVSGSQTVIARSAAVPGQSVVFTATVKPGPAVRLLRVGGDEQTVFSEDPLPAPLAVRVFDSFGNQVPGLSVFFAVISGGGTIGGASVVTDVNGVATSGVWTLGPTPGENRAEANAGGLKIEFTALALARCSADCLKGTLAFVRNDDVYTVNADGSGLTRLTQSGGASEPAWSPDGRRIAFVARTGTRRDVAVMDADGSNVRTIVEAAASPSWSPDGRTLAVAAVRDGGIVIQVVPVDDPSATSYRVGFDRGFNGWPAWAPDNSRIAFVADWTAFDFALELYVARRGEQAAQLTNGFFGNVASWPNYTTYTQPAWSPDGGRLAIVTCSEWQFYSCNTSSLAVMNVDGSGVRTLVGASGYARPTWSPDGSRIAFARTCWDYRCPSAVYSISADGKDERLMIPSAHSPSWRK